MISTDVCILHERRFRADVVIESGDAGAAGLFQFWFSDALSAYGRSFEAVQAVGYKGGNVITWFVFHHSIFFFANFCKYKLFDFL